jgi:tRNA nucleotidyltransferase (CCA-adding enzyme)
VGRATAWGGRPFPAAPRLVAALDAARAVDAGAIAAREAEPHKIAARLRAERVAAVKAALAAR